MTLLCRVCAIFVALSCLLASQECNAAGSAISLVSPAHSETRASSVTFRSVQTSTEADNPGVAAASGGTTGWLRVGIDTWVGGRSALYDLPLAVALSPNVRAQLDVPFVTTATDSYSAGSNTETGLGDIVLSLSYRAEVDDLFEAYSILSTKFASGAVESGLGTGATDFTFTHKTILMLGEYRTTLMAGVTIPLPATVTIMDSSVAYAPTVSYMVATERNVMSNRYRFSLKAAGLHVFNSKVNKKYQQNGLTTLDLIPEITWHYADNALLKLGVIIPLLTRYELPGAESTREPAVTVSAQWFF